MKFKGPLVVMILGAILIVFADDLNALESKQSRLVKEVKGASGQTKASLLQQAREIETQIREKQQQLVKCTGPTLCNGMRECTAAEMNFPPQVVVSFQVHTECRFTVICTSRA